MSKKVVVDVLEDEFEARSEVDLLLHVPEGSNDNHRCVFNTSFQTFKNSMLLLTMKSSSITTSLGLPRLRMPYEHF